MYTDAKQVQLLIVMLKEYGIKRIVISPGTRNFPLVHSIENDPDFICYSIVDERSASYFAMGLILETGEPVAVSCTSGTASANYHSAVCEAYYQKMPLILLTADRNPYYLDHRENQMIPQVNMYGSSCIKAVTIPAIKDAQDEWYCYRTLNEALLETERKEKGPIQINYVLEDWELDRFHTPVLPQLKKMERIFMEDTKLWEEKAREITSAKRVLVVFGQSTPPSNQLTTAIETFFSYTNSVISVDYTANLHCKGTLEMTRLMDSLQGEFFEEIEPDIVISMNNNYLNGIKWALKGTRTLFTHWDVNADGKLVDEYRQLSSVFACTPLEFFEQMNEYLFKEGQIKQEHAYYHTIEEKMKLLSDYDFEYSNLYVMKAFEKKVPAGANLHLGNIRSAYLAQFFPLSEQVRVYAHNGTTTIDGSLSTFVGQAAATDKLSFCFLGDLSFFYDMNALWNRYIKNTMRILLLNNGGG
jgi:2-succinyl-5-enolpyruvyl-6-hydroxy-3-cyclohexene-1-carboxylate synthase